jgi:hypothetical protein
MNTVKQMVAVLALYVVCSAPFISAQLWATWDEHAHTRPFFTGILFFSATTSLSSSPQASTPICVPMHLFYATHHCGTAINLIYLPLHPSIHPFNVCTHRSIYPVTLNSQPSFYFGRRNERCKSVQ